MYSYSHFLPSLTPCSQPTKDIFVHLPHYSVSPLDCPCLFSPSSKRAVCIYISSSPPSHPLSIALPTSLFYFPVISDICYSGHLCSLDQYSVPSSNHQAVHHLTNLLAGLERSVHPVLWLSVYAWGLPSVCVCVLKMRECEGWACVSRRESIRLTREARACRIGGDPSACGGKSQASLIAPGASLLLPCLPHTPRRYTELLLLHTNPTWQHACFPPHWP